MCKKGARPEEKARDPPAEGEVPRRRGAGHWGRRNAARREAPLPPQQRRQGGWYHA